MSHHAASASCTSREIVAAGSECHSNAVAGRSAMLTVAPTGLRFTKKR
jgi:hypothetical protein